MSSSSLAYKSFTRASKKNRSMAAVASARSNNNIVLIKNDNHHFATCRLIVRVVADSQPFPPVPACPEMPFANRHHEIVRLQIQMQEGGGGVENPIASPSSSSSSSEKIRNSSSIISSPPSASPLAGSGSANQVKVKKENRGEAEGTDPFQKIKVKKENGEENSNNNQKGKRSNGNRNNANGGDDDFFNNNHHHHHREYNRNNNNEDENDDNNNNENDHENDDDDDDDENDNDSSFNLDERIMFPGYHSSNYATMVAQLRFLPLPDPDKIQNYFSAFGPVHKFKTDRDSAVVRYDIMDFAKEAKKAHGKILPGTNLRLFVTFGQVRIFTFSTALGFLFTLKIHEHTKSNQTKTSLFSFFFPFLFFFQVSNTIWVGRVHDSMLEKRNLIDAFKKFGRIAQWQLMKDSHCAFIQFLNIRDAVDSVCGINDAVAHKMILDFQVPFDPVRSFNSFIHHVHFHSISGEKQTQRKTQKKKKKLNSKIHWKDFVSQALARNIGRGGKIREEGVAPDLSVQSSIEAQILSTPLQPPQPLLLQRRLPPGGGMAAIPRRGEGVAVAAQVLTTGGNGGVEAEVAARTGKAEIGIATGKTEIAIEIEAVAVDHLDAAEIIIITIIAILEELLQNDPETAISVREDDGANRMTNITRMTMACIISIIVNNNTCTLSIPLRKRERLSFCGTNNSRMLRLSQAINHHLQLFITCKSQCRRRLLRKRTYRHSS